VYPKVCISPRAYRWQLTQVFVADVDATRKRHGSVHDNDFAMVSQGHWLHEHCRNREKKRDHHPMCTQLLDPRTRHSKTTPAVAKKTNGHAATGSVHEFVEEPSPGVVRSD